ncbi:BTAD domain-containing putative transcriptional regulator [Streptomyces leeuwenhoekii]|uniref:AfsR/SARP family transcriptional regulator n=1 Tax=Streptomyces leeuwenhoekii TaxID=1437453 RepID=UPI003681FF94
MKRCGLRFGLLGPPVLYDGRPDGAGVPSRAADGGLTGSAPRVRAVGSPKLRALLAVLLLEAGRTVTAESLKEALWGGAPPPSAQASLHNHVARLRRLLDDPDRLRTVPSGYVLRVRAGELDVHVFEAGAAEARSAHAAQAWERVLRASTAALALWRGAPLAGLPAEVGGYAFAQRLEEARLLLLERRYDAALALGGALLADAVPELTALVAEHPLREAYQRQLMLALHRTGRQAEALAVHRDLRARLVEELGIEPGPAVREAHVEVLRGAAGRVPEAGEPTGEEAPDGGPGAGTDVAAGMGVGASDVGASDALPGPPAPPLASACPAPSAPSAPPASPASPASSASPVSPAPSGPPAPSASPAPPLLSASPASPASPAPPVSPAPSGPPAPSGRSAPPPPPGSSVPPAAPMPPAPPVAPAPQGAPGGGSRGPRQRFCAHRPRPAQLPPPPAHFTGRADVLDELRRALRPGAQPAVAVISGMAGVGKSALALHAAHGLKERFSDGQLYLDLQGATPGLTPLTTGQALTALLRDLGADPRDIPERPHAAAALLRSLLAPTRTLLVLDDAASAAQVRPLLPAGPGCAVIVTSRSPLTALDGAHRFPLAPLSGEESAALLRAVSRRGGREERPGLPGESGHGRRDGGHLPGEGDGDGDHGGLTADHPLVELTGRLPLALRVVAARLAARSALTPDALAGRLADAEGRLNHLEYDDLSVRASLAVAHDALAASDREPDRDAARALRHIGALHLPAYSAPLLARLTGTDERRAEAALDRLADVALLEETAYGRYAPHDLVRAFARELAGGDDGADAAETALRWYAAVAERTLTALVEPGPDLDDRRRPTAAQPPAHTAHVATVPPFGSAAAAFAWWDGELGNVVVLAERCAGETGTAPGAGGDGTDRHAAWISVLARLLFPCLRRGGRIAEMEVLGRAALGAARRLGDEAAEAYALGDLAGLRFLTGRHTEALALGDEALALWRRLGRAARVRRCLSDRGLLLAELGRHAEAERALRRSLARAQRLDDRYGEAVTRGRLGTLYQHTDPRAAIEQHRRSLALGDALGHVIVRHTAHCDIGYVHLALGQPAAAAAHFWRSLHVLGAHGDWHGESRSRLGLVRALRRLGRGDQADRACAELLRRAEARADRHTEGLARHQLGLLLRERGRGAEARAQWRAALAALEGTDTAVVGELRELLGDGPGTI